MISMHQCIEGPQRDTKLKKMLISHIPASAFPYEECAKQRFCPTLAMVSWNLKSGSSFFGDSAENWASDRKLVV